MVKKLPGHRKQMRAFGFWGVTPLGQHVYVFKRTLRSGPHNGDDVPQPLGARQGRLG